MEMQAINFEVKRIENAEKNGMAKTTVVYNGSSKEYTYIRKCWYDKKDATYRTIIEGVEISFIRNIDGKYLYTSCERKYNTKGIKRASTSIKNKEKKVEQIKVEQIKDEIKEAKIEIPFIQNENIQHKEYENIRTCIQNNIPVYLAGPAGSGKNYTVEKIAKELGLDFYFANSVQQEYKLAGYEDASGNYHETEFYKAFKNGGIFFLDEMDASIPEVLILLNAAIANGYFAFPNGKIYAHPDFRVVAAGNTLGSGADEQYTGRMVLDQATLDRFVVIEFDYDINVELNLAKGNRELVEFIEKLREINDNNCLRYTFSYRAIISVTKLESTSMDETKILTIAIFKGMNKDTLNMFNNSMDIDNKYSRILKEMVA